MESGTEGLERGDGSLKGLIWFFGIGFVAMTFLSCSCILNPDIIEAIVAAAPYLWNAAIILGALGGFLGEMTSQKPTIITVGCHLAVILLAAAEIAVGQPLVILWICLAIVAFEFIGLIVEIANEALTLPSVISEMIVIALALSYALVISLTIG